MKRELDSILLTRQELQIMKVVWELGSATVKDVCKVLFGRRPVAYTTVLTLMGILEQKGVLSHERAGSGRAYLYRPVLSYQQAVRNQIRDIVTRFFDGSPRQMIESVLDSEVPAAEQVAFLEALIESRDKSQVA